MYDFCRPRLDALLLICFFPCVLRRFALPSHAQPDIFSIFCRVPYKEHVQRVVYGIKSRYSWHSVGQYHRAYKKDVSNQVLIGKDIVRLHMAVIGVAWR